MGPRRGRRPSPGLTGAAVLVPALAAVLLPACARATCRGARDTRAATATVRSPSAPLLAGALRRLGLTVHVRRSHTARVVDGAARRRAGPHRVLAVDTESAWRPAARRDRPFAVVRHRRHDRPRLWTPGTLGAASRPARVAPGHHPRSDSGRPRRAPDGLLASRVRSAPGVERAIDVVERALDRDGAPSTCAGRSCTTPTWSRLDQTWRGLRRARSPRSRGQPLVLAAHGARPPVRADAAARNSSVIDATCPLVAKVHSEVRRFAAASTRSS
jgi:4-hydroxy-3-methylbut-2-enyl diphosphate reductase